MIVSGEAGSRATEPGSLSAMLRFSFSETGSLRIGFADAPSLKERLRIASLLERLCETDALWQICHTLKHIAILLMVLQKKFATDFRIW
jgi:hypothetical protein